MAIDERFGPTRRGGPVFRWLGEPLAIDLANTVMVVPPTEEGTGRDAREKAVDLLPTPAELGVWLGAEGERLADYEIDPDADLATIRGLRDTIRALFRAAAEEGALPPNAVAAINEASAAAPISPQLVAATSAAGRYATDLAAERSVTGLLGAIARSAIELLHETPPGELRICRAPSCGMFYLGRRRWCCSACGNRARAARHYRRSKAA